MNQTIEPPSADLTYWEQIGTTKWGSYTSGIEARAIDRAHELLPKPTTALEIGCEGGRWSKRLADCGWDMICTDVNRDTLNVCQERIPNARCIHVEEDRRDLPAADNEVDLVLCIEVPPVIHADWFPDELDRVLRDDGYLVGVFFNNCSARGGLAHRKAERNGSFDFYKLPYAPWRQQLQERGYDIIHEEGYCWFPFHRDSNSGLVPVATGLEKGLGLRKLAKFSPWVVFIAHKAGNSGLPS